ncbi:hypothetical protein QJ857_gp0991 [Tupanvirus soda lake]|uniref:Ankyrin repeat protein n=2 Tax=Tupanvirus TaxID=2094720 RepID=A0A6N1NUF2_9VIRU|nr:hypothetical protein QJ857_gp0991 [Tupanvirus soda lake]QKU35063.1 hypothetical protein [Tupanvirus soda lake]
MVFTIMNPGDMFYDDDGIMEHNKMDNNESHRETEIYKYYLEHDDNDNLKSIIKTAKKISHSYQDIFLRTCYSKLIINGMDNIIFDIISGNNSNDELIICLIAIEMDRRNIIEHLISKGFNLNQMVLQDNKLSFLNFDVLTYAVRKNNLQMVKYLVELGANPTSNNLMALQYSCVYKTREIFEYFIDLEIPYDVLKFIFVHCCTTHNIENKIFFIKKIINKGLNLSNINDILDNCIGNLSADDVQYLIDNGYTISSTKPLHMACKKSNTELIDFLLSYGLQPDKTILDTVFGIFNVPTIEIFIKHRIDLSGFTVALDNNQFISDLQLCGMNKDTLITLILKKINPNTLIDFDAYKLTLMHTI